MQRCSPVSGVKSVQAPDAAPSCATRKIGGAQRKEFAREQVSDHQLRPGLCHHLRRERDRLKQTTARLEDEAREARERAEKAEKEMDDLRALLKEARDCVEYLGRKRGWPMSKDGLLVRIDAALKEDK